MGEMSYRPLRKDGFRYSTIDLSGPSIITSFIITDKIALLLTFLGDLMGVDKIASHFTKNYIPDFITLFFNKSEQAA